MRERNTIVNYPYDRETSVRVTVAELYSEGVELVDSSSPTPHLDVEVLLSTVLGISKIAIYTRSDDVVTAEDVASFRDKVMQRSQGVPVAYLVGSKEFWKDTFIVDEAVLIPRPDTEVLIRAALREVPRLVPPGGALRLLDLGVGSGCIVISLLKEFQSMGYNVTADAVDISSAALRVCEENCLNHGVLNRVELLRSDWYSEMHEGKEYDIVVTNPPYVEDGSREMSVGTGFEPMQALYAGPDGLSDIRRILEGLSRYLSPNGVFLCEIGAHHKEAVTAIFESRPELQRYVLSFDRDLAGFPRVMVVRPG
jgi:release factor glutamine methyltransferase